MDDLGRERALLHVLMTLMSYPMEVDIILVSNTGVKAAEGLVWRQALRPQPFCNKTFQHGFCLCWEALHALREAALTGDVEMSGPGVADTARTDKIGASQSKQLAYDYYVYMEADLLLPAASFYFFARYADTLFHRGYKLKAHRREPGGPSGARMADMRPHLFNCEYSTLFDESANASYLDSFFMSFMLASDVEMPCGLVWAQLVFVIDFSADCSMFFVLVWSHTKIY